jgi:signal transduction histidine kinase
MAHELKTPISAIVSAAEMMKDERLGAIGDPRYLRYAQDIHGSARHALAVIERMLGQRQSRHSTFELSFTNLDINALAAGLLSGLESMANEAGLALSGALAPRVPLVVADATSVRQIILNAITNALKFTPRGGTVQVITEMTADGHLAVSVIDSGPGMSADEIARVMADGRAAASKPQQARTGGGLGIGLPLARMLATANGAILAITTPETGGTRVTLAFPASRLIPI